MAKKKNQKNKTMPCPECQTRLEMPENLKVGQVTECNACGAEIEVLSTLPLTGILLEEEK